MRRSRRSTDRAARPPRDDGSASIEFLAVGLILLVPIVYLVLVLAQAQGAALAVDGAARQASRVFVQSDTVADASAAAQRAVAVTLADYGIEAGDAAVAITCRPAPADCLTRRGFVTVAIEVEVALPLVPVFGGGVPPSIPVRSTATEQVSRFQGSR